MFKPCCKAALDSVEQAWLIALEVYPDLAPTKPLVAWCPIDGEVHRGKAWDNTSQTDVTRELVLDYESLDVDEETTDVDLKPVTPSTAKVSNGLMSNILKRPIIAFPGNPALMLVPVKYKDETIYSTIDAIYAGEVGKYNWVLATKGYAQRISKGRCIFLHRFIAQLAGLSLEADIDHRDHDKLKNTLTNIRPATKSQNSRNQHVRSDNTSGYKGISWDKINNKWRVQIWIEGKKIYLGRFTIIEDAALAYDTASRELHGAFGYQNLPAPANDNGSPQNAANDVLEVSAPATAQSQSLSASERRRQQLQ